MYSCSSYCFLCVLCKMNQLRQSVPLTLQISTSRAPCLRPACQANPRLSTCVTTPSGCTWNPSCPNGFLFNASSWVTLPCVTDLSRTTTFNIFYKNITLYQIVYLALFITVLLLILSIKYQRPNEDGQSKKKSLTTTIYFYSEEILSVMERQKKVVAIN